MRDLFNTQTYNISKSSVKFLTADKELQFIFDKCEQLCKNNIKTFNDYDVLIEGAKYNGVWLETQPLGGEMYAKRDIKTALSNILIFLLNQRRDGKYPGMISNQGEWSRICVHYDWMQGCFLPYPALKMYYHLNKDTQYLSLVYNSLRDFDDYLWRYRDSTGSGVLENWSIWDVGEDNSTVFMLHGLKQPENGAWGKSTPPKDIGNMPHKSPQYMAYSFAIRTVLAKISAILCNGKENMWQEKAATIQEKAIEHFWDKNRKAFYIKDKNDEFIDALTQENIKCMYCGIFTQEMADEFIKEHLLNKDEFFTPYPLPAIAANSPYFHVNKEYSNCAERIKKLGITAHDIDDNSWSGPLNGLIWQRSIDALLNYNHHAETLLIGEKILELLKREKKFVQIYNPFTGKASEGSDGYGPTMLSALEYISILYGVNVSYEEVLWSPTQNSTYEYTQDIYNKKLTLKCGGDFAQAYIENELVFECSPNMRVKTDLNGNTIKIHALKNERINVVLNGETLECLAKPNDIYVIENKKLVLSEKIAFDYET